MAPSTPRAQPRDAVLATGATSIVQEDDSASGQDELVARELMRDRGQMRPVADRVVVCDVSGDVNCRHLHSSKSGIAIKFMLRGTEKTPALSLDAERGPRTPLAELDQVEELALLRLGDVRRLVRILRARQRRR